MRRVVIESPYAGDIERNTAYARRALAHSLSLGEAPIASHLLYPQVLNELKAEERKAGIEAGLAWMRDADRVVFYMDYGMSSGMRYAEGHAQGLGKEITHRFIGRNEEK